MANSGFASPVLVRPDGTSTVLKPVPISGSAAQAYNEAWLQELLYRHPEVLPIAEIDASYSGLVPLCMEMDTPAGPVDAVFITPTGRLVLLEAKLWRNPEARRKVLAQILDYAKELPSWDYSRFDGAVRQARKRDPFTAAETFPGVAELVQQVVPGLVLHQFQDAVSRSLAKGDYLLLVAGDGIREGVGAIAQFLDRNGSLPFTFGLIECAIYGAPDGGHFVQPRVLAQTTNLIRTVIVRGAQILEVEPEIEKDGNDDPDLVEARARFKSFWSEFLGRVRVEETQPISPPATSTNQYFMMPKGSNGWVSAYLSQSKGQVGVYLTFAKGETGLRLAHALELDKADIESALGVAVEWRRDRIVTTKNFAGLLMTDSREDVLSWLADRTERFVSVFRPRIDKLIRDSDDVAVERRHV